MAAEGMELFGVWGDEFYKRNPPQYPSDNWIASATKIGTSDWSQFKHLFFHPDGTLYGVFNDKFYKRNPPAYGSDNWIGSATLVGTDSWSNFKHLFFHPDGTLYGVWKDNLYKRAPPTHGGDNWIGSATLIGKGGWNSPKFLFFDANGILYGVYGDDFYKRVPASDGGYPWDGCTTLLGAGGWSTFDKLFFMADGHLYGVQNGKFYRRTPPVQGSDKWKDTAKCIGTDGWSHFKFLISRRGNATQFPPFVIGAVWPPGMNEAFGQGSREYQFFRAALKWLESEGTALVPRGTLSRFLQEAQICENGMMNWSNVFNELEGRTTQELYRSALKRITQSMKQYAFASEEGERQMYRTLSQMARHIANNRGEVTGHGNITEEWEGIANEMERDADRAAQAFGDVVEAAEAPTAEAVEAGVGFAEAAEAAAAGAEVAEASVGVGEVLEILGLILLL